MIKRNLLLPLLCLPLLGLSAGCGNAYKLKNPPAGFVETPDSSPQWGDLRMKAADNVGLTVK